MAGGAQLYMYCCPYGKNRAGVSRAGLSCMCIQEPFFSRCFAAIRFTINCALGENFMPQYAIILCMDNADFVHK